MARTEASAEDVLLAHELWAEWDQGRGTSKSEIERRVWGDGGAHGRRFDRFIRQTLGVATNRPSKQTDRIAVLERQLRRVGVDPEGLTPQQWELQLRHGRHAALAALRAWNDPTGSFRTESFALLFVAAWNSVLLALLQRSGTEWRELDATRAPKLIDGRERTLETGVLLGVGLPGEQSLALRRNVEFWIGLRNVVAHRHLPALDMAVIPQAQAGILNLETVLSEHFGADYQLGDAVSVPLQLTGFRDPAVLASVKRLQGSLPLDVQSYLASQWQRNEVLANDPGYMLRVTFLPTVPSSGRGPDLVAYFVKPGEVTEEMSQALKEYLILPKVVTPPRPNLIATQVVAAVKDQIPYVFTVTMHTAATRKLKARPEKGTPDESATDPRYCEYVTSLKRHLYNRAWVDRLVSELSTEAGFRAATGVEPEPRL